ncbi:hypothetical protein GLAREA_04509 [Glarea lozoyensis ATCC 20868]|uniref:MARVEL domain-containing protein n=1 Tax=Glarea lozoyensis (strain ATCC 20868 / MF5171) TaxID=1116229 RepID=S3DMI3_GLAL2|nr:uncharacterized protein GLAREA_04509 [Glarea lozoyensis ATCC 20868]EPE27718.1 hypothetical protein GLAREA_04509 [Glarea lozoyensis ATCC 20868]
MSPAIAKVNKVSYAPNEDALDQIIVTNPLPTFSSTPSPGQPGHITYMITLLFCLLLSIWASVTRLSSLCQTHSPSQLTMAHYTVILTYLLTSVYCIGSTVLYFGYRIVDPANCHTAIHLGLAFYIFQKFLGYLFLAERAHSVEAHS